METLGHLNGSRLTQATIHPDRNQVDRHLSPTNTFGLLDSIQRADLVLQPISNQLPKFDWENAMNNTIGSMVSRLAY